MSDPIITPAHCALPAERAHTSVRALHAALARSLQHACCKLIWQCLMFILPHRRPMWLPGSEPPAHLDGSLPGEQHPARAVGATAGCNPRSSILLRKYCKSLFWFVIICFHRSAVDSCSRA